MKLKTPYEMYESRVSEWIPWHLEELKTNFVSACGSLYFEYRKLAVLEWHLNRDAKKFKEHMKTAVEYNQKGFLSTLTEVPNNKTYTSCVPAMLDAMSSGDQELMESYITLMDDHFDDVIKPRTHPTNALYMCCVILTTGRYTDNYNFQIEQLKKGYLPKKWLKLMPIALMLEAICNKDKEVFNEQAHIFANNYKSMTRGIFSNYEEKLLSLWGIGLCNLATMKGMKVTIDHPFIPKELIG